MSDTSKDEPPPPVPEGATQGGEIRARWAWVEPTVWSERMLEALEQGGKGGVWFSLIDKVYASRTLAAAWRQVHARDGAGGVDRQTVAPFAPHAAQHLPHLSAALRTGTYVPQPVRRCWIDKRGSAEKRPLGIPTGKDRVVQTALRSLATIIAGLNPVLRGWFGYFKHSHPPTVRPINGWVRMRLRSLLRKRRGQRGRGRGADPQRWPNAYVHALGLYSLVEARPRVLRSP